MASDKENILSPNMDMYNYVRPLSAYDNLHSTSVHSPSPTQQQQQQQCHHHQQQNEQQKQQQKSSSIHSNGNEKEFPFNNISFRFDDLPLQNQPNHFNQIRTNSTISNSKCNGNHNKSSSQGYPTITNHNGIKIITSNETVEAKPPVATVDSDSDMLFGATKQQYENVSETVRLRNLNSNKPVISEAKSSFFGLNNASSLNNSKQNMSSRHNNPNSGGYEDCSPLLNNASGAGSHSLYQNIPSNSACFDSDSKTLIDAADKAVVNTENMNGTRSETSSDCADSSENNNASKYYADTSNRMSQSPSQVNVVYF